MWIGLKSWAGCFSLLLLLSGLSLPIYSQEKIELTMEEFNAISSALEMAQSELMKAKASIQLLKDTLNQQNEILRQQQLVWPMLRESLSKQETDLKSEYWRGVVFGGIIGLAAGFVAGETIGIYMGFRIPVP